MNAQWTNRRPYLALIADDADAAQRLTRMLLAHGAPSVRCITPAEQASALLQLSGQLPDLLIVDMQDSPEITADLIRSIRSALLAPQLAIAAMVPARDRQVHELQYVAGADIVVERMPDATDYRREAARLVSYWVKVQRLDAVGA